MKENFIHVCFVIDSSGSMCGSEADVIGGFKRVVDEQKANENGSCVVSVVDFNSYPEVVCIGKDVNDIDSDLNYTVGGGTALLDAIYSRAHGRQVVKDKIAEMETEFGWSFVYLGADLTNVNDASSLGIKTRGVSTKSAMMSNYDMVNTAVSTFRSATGDSQIKFATMDMVMGDAVETLNANYETSTGIKIK